MGNTSKSGHLALMVAAINLLLERSLIARTPSDPPSPEHGYIIVNLAGHPTAIVWHDAGYGELSISVWWKIDVETYVRTRSAGMSPFRTTLPIARKKQYPRLVGVTGSVWLERKDGLFIQGEPPRLFDVYTRKGEAEELRKVPWEEPNGFEISGNYYL